MKKHASSGENGANNYNIGNGKRKIYPPYMDVREDQMQNVGNEMKWVMKIRFVELNSNKL